MYIATDPILIIIYVLIVSVLLCPYSLSELPECQVPLAMRTDVIDQTLAIAMHPAIVSSATIQCLTQSPDAHAHVARRETVESMLQVCKLRQKMVSEQSLPQQVEKKDEMMINALKYVLL